MYHIDKREIVRYLRVGEGGCQQTEQQIRVKNPPGREQVAIRLAGTSFPQNRFNNSDEKFRDQERCTRARKNTKRRRITMKSKGYLWFNALLIGSALVFPPIATAAEKAA